MMINNYLRAINILIPIDNIMIIQEIRALKLIELKNQNFNLIDL